MRGVVETIKCAMAISRPIGWKAYLWMGLLGFIKGANFNFVSGLVFTYSLLSYLATAFAINNLFDSQGDLINPSKNNPLNRGCNKLGVYVVVCNQLLALVAVLVFTPLKCVITYILAVAFSVIYSAPPLRLKSRAGLDVLSHVLYFGILLYLYGLYLAGGEITLPILPMIATIGFYSAFLQLRNLEEDRLYDMMYGDKTLFVVHPILAKYLLVLTGISSMIGSIMYVPFNPLVVVPLLTFSSVVGYRYRWKRFVDAFVVFSLILGVIK
mgnify:CR=1 FL=1